MPIVLHANFPHASCPHANCPHAICPHANSRATLDLQSYRLGDHKNFLSMYLLIFTIKILTKRDCKIHLAVNGFKN